MITTTEKYVNPFTDFGFKKIFGTEVNQDLLIDFLNELINDKGKISSVRYLNSNRLGASVKDRSAIFDIYCESESGEKFIVEMQRAKQNYFKDRSVFYSTFPIREQAQPGDWNFELKAVYTVGILDFTFNENKDDSSYYHSEVKLMDTERKTVFYDKLTFVYLELPKFNKAVSELNTHFEKWMYVLKNLSKLQNRPVQLQERVFERLFRVAEIAKFSRDELAEYEDSLKRYRDMNNVINTAKQDGWKEGKEEGRKEGQEQGRTMTLEATIRRCEQKGMSIDEIADITDLPYDEVKNIIDKIRDLRS